jgi:hypothetical protein
MPNVDEVLVVAPLVDNPDAAEVLWFDSDALTQAFDAALVVRKEENPKLSRTAPIFVDLDGPPDATSGFRAKAKSQAVIDRSRLLMHRRANQAAEEGFIERVKREFAEMIGVDASKVSVEFKIVA